jgi:hypothetical protein
MSTTDGKSKQEFMDQMNNQLKAWQAEIDRLKAKAAESEARARSEYYNEISNLEMKKNNLSDQLEKMKTAGEGAWGDMKAGLQKAWRELDESFRNALEKFK